MSALTDVAKQALEYFHDRGCIDTYSEEWGFYLALRDALAQEPKVGEKSLGTENSAGVDALRDAAQQALDWLYGNDILHPTKVSQDLRAALEQAEPEPVAWVRLESWKSGEEWPDDCFTAEKSEGLTPLYTAPPQRKPLTDEEIEKLFGGAVADVPRAHWLRQAAIEVVRKTEAAHGIGEEE